MKNIIFILFLFILTTILVDCKKDKKEDEIAKNANLNITVDNAYPRIGQTVNLTINISCVNELSSFKITRITRDSVITFDTTFVYSETGSIIYYKYIIPQTAHLADTILFISYLTAKEVPDISDTQKIIVRSTPFRLWANQIILSDQNSTGYCYFSSLDGNTYNYSEAILNSDIIDITYGVLSVANGNESLISPDLRTMYGYNSINDAKATYFRHSLITASVFDNLVNDSLIYNINGLTEKKVSLAKDSVYDFINSKGKKGLIKVDSIFDNKAYIKVKVQE